MEIVTKKLLAAVNHLQRLIISSKAESSSKANEQKLSVLLLYRQTGLYYAWLEYKQLMFNNFVVNVKSLSVA